MSRAALWRQEVNVKERERRAEQLFEDACAAGRHQGRNAMMTWTSTDDRTFHWNPLLLHNTIHSTYFQKCCSDFHDWNGVIDEIYYQVQHLEPFSSGSDKQPSTAFCLLLRLLTLRLTEHQLELTLKHADSPYIRGLGFLYLRYVGMPDRVWTWIEPFLYDEQEFTVEARGGTTTTMGEFVRQLFGSREFRGTALPRYPIKEERALQVRLLQAEQVAQRAARHFQDKDTLRHFATLGSTVMALYGDDENPVTWYKAVVDRVIAVHPETGSPLRCPRYIVTFTEYGNTETVLLGEMDLLNGTWSQEDPAQQQQCSAAAAAAPHSSRTGHGGGSRDLYEQVRQRERETATADRKWSRRPPSTKSALAAQNGGGSSNHHSRSVVDDEGPRHPRNHRDHHHRPEARSSRQPEPEARKKRSADEIRAIQEKKQKLLAKYG